MGEEKQQSIEQTKKCPKCAEDVQNDAVACKHCGAKFVGSGRKQAGIIFLVLLIIIIIFIEFGSFGDNSINSEMASQKVQEPEKNIQAENIEKNNSNEGDNVPISEEKYKARIFSEGEKISRAGVYIVQAGKFYEDGDYGQSEEILYKASDIFRDVNWTFKGQKNPPVKYMEFNKNMIVIFSDISDSIDNIATDIAYKNNVEYKKELSNLTKLITKANTEMTKASF